MDLLLILNPAVESTLSPSAPVVSSMKDPEDSGKASGSQSSTDCEDEGTPHQEEKTRENSPESRELLGLSCAGQDSTIHVQTNDANLDTTIEANSPQTQASAHESPNFELQGCKPSFSSPPVKEVQSPTKEVPNSSKLGSGDSQTLEDRLFYTIEEAYTKADDESQQHRLINEQSDIAEFGIEMLKNIGKTVEVADAEKESLLPNPYEPVEEKPKKRSPGKRMLKSLKRSSSWGPNASHRATPEKERVPKQTVIKVFFASSTSVDTERSSIDKMRAFGVIKASKVAACDVFCVRKSAALKKTYNLILAIISGKPIITEDWLHDSLRVGTRHNYNNYPVKAPRREKEWGFKIAAAIERGRKGHKALDDYEVAVTESAEKALGAAFKDIDTVVEAAGSEIIIISEASHIGRPKDNVLMISSQDDSLLGPLTEAGWRCYNKDILTMSILRGVVDTKSDEFLLEVDEAVAEKDKPPKKKRKVSR